MTEQPVALHRAVEAAKALRSEIFKLVISDRVEHGELSADDAATIQDTFDGETTLEAELLAAIKAEDDDLILLDGIAKRAEELTIRKKRIENRKDARRGLIEQAMTVAGWPKHETPLGTLSMGKAPDNVTVEEESQVPARFWKRPDPVLNKTDLNKVVKAFHKAVDAANKLKDTAQQADALLAALNASDMPSYPERSGRLSTVAQINNPETRVQELNAIINTFGAVPGCRFEIGGANLTIRRK